jgi:drug/metabolite transporter (DMT)-like permease
VRGASATQVVVAFALVYVVWGSTYLAIRVAVESLPILLYAGVRFLVAGAVLYGVFALRGLPRITARHWRDAAIVGALLLLGGNGMVSVAERTVPSGIAAVIIATVPLAMVLLNWASSRRRPSAPLLGAIGLGLAGVALLVGPSGSAASGRVDPVGAGLLVLASVSWAAGSLYSSRAAIPSSPLLATGMQELAGGALLILAGALTGEVASLDPGAFTGRSLIALLYLIAFGSLVGFTAYIWLLRHVAPELVSTYAFVNPVIAVFLGWMVLGEEISLRTIVASGIIVLAVAIITVEQARNAIRERRERESAEAEPAASVAK